MDKLGEELYLAQCVSRPPHQSAPQRFAIAARVTLSSGSP